MVEMMGKKGGKPGNKNGVKLKDPDVRQEAYRQYCAHIASGESKESFVFEHAELTCTHQTMEKYIAANPIEFLPIHKQVAESLSFLHWTGLGKQMMLGQIEKCQPAIFQMFMRNKFGWDKEEKSDSSVSYAEKVLDHIMGRKDK
jgi:hypothetical protein